MKYFAFGSNMSTQRLTAAGRAPSATFVAVACLPDYALRFNKRSKDGSGKANIVYSKGAVVWGVVFELNSVDFEELDLREGRGYERLELSVIRRDDHMSLVVNTYVARRSRVDEGLAPLPAYLRHLLDGAVEHGLPEDYIRILSATRDAEP